MAYRMRWPPLFLIASLAAICPLASRAQLIEMTGAKGDGGNFKVPDQRNGNAVKRGGMGPIFSDEDVFSDVSSASPTDRRLRNYGSLEIFTGELVGHKNPSRSCGREGTGPITSTFVDCLTYAYPYLAKNNSLEATRESTFGFCSDSYDLDGAEIVESYWVDAPLLYSFNPKFARVLGCSRDVEVGSIRITGVNHPHFVERKGRWLAPHTSSSTNIGSLSVPEPATVVLLATLLGGLSMSYRMRCQSKRNGLFRAS